MDNQAKLQQRKAALQAKIALQQAEIKKTLLELRDEIEPSKLLKKAVGGALGFGPAKPGEEKPGIFDRLPAPVSMLLDLMIRDPRWSFLVKILAPFALRYLPGKDKKTAPEQPELEAENPPKTNIYGRLRKGVSSLRDQLRRKEKTPEIPAELPETTPETLQN